MGFLKRLFGREREPVLGPPPSPGAAPPDKATVVDLPPPPGEGTGNVGAAFSATAVFVNGQAADPEQLGEAERLSGFDLDGDGRIADGPAAANDFGDMVEDQLDALHQAGALSDEELAEKKAKLRRAMGDP